MMDHMAVFTLDTSCVIAVVKAEPDAIAVEGLIDAARAGQVKLWTTAAFDADMTRASNENLSANLGWLADQPILQGAPGPFRLGYSMLDGPDVLISEADAEAVAAVEGIVLPAQYRQDQVSLPEEAFIAKWNRRTNDVQHLAAHHIAGHDAFVTSDRDDIINKRDQLLELGIRVYTPEEALRALKPDRLK